jgi:TPR repeat protein
MQKRSTSDGFNDIPENVAAVVFSHLGKNPRHRIRLAAVSKVWRDAEKSDLSLPGAPRALFELGEDLIGKETKVSFRKAFYWYRKAADLGDADAMWMIGVTSAATAWRKIKRWRSNCTSGRRSKVQQRPHRVSGVSTNAASAAWRRTKRRR